MKHNLRLLIGAALILVPVAIVLAGMLGLWRVEGGHGLMEWFLDSACFCLVLLGTLLSGWAARRPGHGRRLPMGMAWFGVLMLVLFVVRFGVPFSR